MTGWQGRRPDRPLTRHLDALDGFSQVTLLVRAKATSTAGSGALDNAAGMERVSVSIPLALPAGSPPLSGVLGVRVGGVAGS